jgi:hypothetical protein
LNAATFEKMTQTILSIATTALPPLWHSIVDTTVYIHFIVHTQTSFLEKFTRRYFQKVSGLSGNSNYLISWAVKAHLTAYFMTPWEHQFSASFVVDKIVELQTRRTENRWPTNLRSEAEKYRCCQRIFELND